MHTLLDLRGPIPTFIEVSDGKLHDVNILDAIVPEPASFYVMDRAYVDFQRLHVLHRGGAFFVSSHQERDPVPPAILSTQRRLERGSIRSYRCAGHLLPPRQARAGCAPPHSLSRCGTRPLAAFSHEQLRVRCPRSPSAGSTSRAGKWNCSRASGPQATPRPAKKFYGNSENAVQTQIWIAVSVKNVLVANVKKRKKRTQCLHEGSHRSLSDARCSKNCPF